MPRHPEQDAALARHYKKRKEKTESSFKEAMNRLLLGESVHTNGKLTEANLCREAQRSRATLNRYPHIKTSFADAIKNLNKNAPGNMVEKIKELEETIGHMQRQDNKKIKSLGESRDRYAQEAFILSRVIELLRTEVTSLNSRLEEAIKGTPLRLVANKAAKG